MPDYIVKIIPSDPYLCITEQQSQNAVQLIKQNANADIVKVSMRATPAFVDCGQNLTNISCPCCGSRIDFGWWGEAMNNAFESNFLNLSIKLPCCGSDSTLNELVYDFPCGFSSVEFSITHAESNVNDTLLTSLQNLLGTPMRVIHVRY